MTLKNMPKKTGAVQELWLERLSIFLEKMRSAASREISEDVVVRGLPPQNARSSKLKPP